MFPNGLPTETITALADKALGDIKGCIVFLVMMNQAGLKRGLRATLDARVDIVTVSCFS